MRFALAVLLPTLSALTVWAAAGDQRHACGWRDGDEVSANGEPATKLSAILEQHGVVLISGTSLLGEIRTLQGASVAVKGLEAKSAAGTTQRGLIIAIHEAGQLLDRCALVDMEEIPELISAMNRLLQIDSSATTLDNLTASYRTQGRLRISTYTSDETEAAFTVYTGADPPTGAHLRRGDFQKFRDMVVAAKTKLDTIRGQQ